VAEKIRPKTIVRQTTHPGDTRPNIPTAELESFARPEEKRPAIVRKFTQRIAPGRRG
jgi:hypothetical protein